MAKNNPFSLEIEFEYGVAAPLSSAVRRFVAHNPGPLTFKGTNVYIVGRSEVAIIDPGPDDEAHIRALMHSLEGEAITKIILTHTHKDHCGGLERLQGLTGAKTYGFWAPDAVRGAYKTGQDGALAGEFADATFKPDHHLSDGDEITGEDWTLRAIHTPGHAPDHLCYELHQEKSLFTGDHIMPWSTTVIAPPEGNMKDYMSSLEKLACRDDELYLPGHGGRVRKPKRLTRAYILHRQWREKSILNAVVDGRRRVDEIVCLLYRDIDKDIKPAASLSVLAHLQHLVAGGKIRQTSGQGLRSVFEALRS